MNSVKKIGVICLVLAFVVLMLECIFKLGMPYSYLFITGALLMAALGDIVRAKEYKTKFRFGMFDNLYMAVIETFLAVIMFGMFLAGPYGAFKLLLVFIVVGMLGMIYMTLKFHFTVDMVNAEMGAKFNKTLMAQNRRLINICEDATDKLEILLKERNKYKKMAISYLANINKRKKKR